MYKLYYILFLLFLFSCDDSNYKPEERKSHNAIQKPCLLCDDSNYKPEERKSHNAIQKPCLSEECMKNIIKTAEENLEKIDVENVYLDNDSINSEYLLGYFYYRLLDEAYSDLRLIWITQHDSTQRILILLLEYKHTVSYDDCLIREKHWFS